MTGTWLMIWFLVFATLGAGVGWSARGIVCEQRHDLAGSPDHD